MQRRAAGEVVVEALKRAMKTSQVVIPHTGLRVGPLLRASRL